MAADNSSSYLPDAMDKLWFQQNIFFLDTAGINSESRKSTSVPISERSSRSESADENKNMQSAYKKKRPAKLSTFTSQPLFQLQQLPRTQLRSHASSPSIITGIQPRKRRVPEKIRSYKSSSELENYELRGLIDLGFVFHKEKLNPQMISTVPGLQRLREWAEESDDERTVKRPYLSEAWLFNRQNSPLLNLHLLPKSPEEADVKKHLRFWAREVASLIQQES